VHGRNPARVEKTTSELKAFNDQVMGATMFDPVGAPRSGHVPPVMAGFVADLSSFEEVRRLAKEVSER
jgi:hypothetical protein